LRILCARGIFIYYFWLTDYDYRMFFRNIYCVILLLTFFQIAFAQTTSLEKPKAVTDELRKEAVAFLRETGADVGNLRSLENRISFSSEMAGLMWFYDEKEAAAMYGAVINDFKQLLADYDAQINALGITPSETEYRVSMFGGDQNDKTRITQKFYKAMGVRQQIAMSLAEHDATLAYNFYYDTLSLITNAELRKTTEQRDSYFESQFIKQLALKDPSKAVELGRKSLAKGVNWTHADLLRQIYEKDDAKGAEFAAEIVKKFKDDRVSPENLGMLGSFLRLGAENFEKIKKEGGKKPMFSEQNLRDMAELLAQGIMERKSGVEIYEVANSIGLIEKYAPARAVQIRAKFPQAVKPKTTTATVVSEESEDAPRIEVKNTAATKVEAENQVRKEQESEMMKNVQKLGSKELPKEERDKIVAQSRKIIGGMGRKEEKIMALSMLASQVSAAGDKELAADIMKDASTLVNPSPKNYKDFMEVWFLASAYSATDPDKAFPLLEDAIFRLNDTLSALIKVGEFIDVSGEMIDDGEVQLGALGGSMVNGLTRELGIANSTIRNLAIADFGKTKALTNKFDRAEVRILAKMLILRAVLGDKAETPNVSSKKVTEEF
jgi:hypothetical protein